MIETTDKSPREEIHTAYARYQIESSLFYVDFNGIFWWYHRNNPIRRKEEMEIKKKERICM